MRRLLGSLALVIGLHTPAVAWAEEVVVFAAASLRGALEEALQGFSAPVSVSHGGSGTMARQIAAGAPADLAVLADTIWADWLRDQGVAGTAPPAPLLGNRLVMVTSLATLNTCAQALTHVQTTSARLAMGHRTGVPAGRYGAAWLRHIGAWEATAPHLAEVDNVRAALALVARGQAPVGIVYATDAQAAPMVRVLCTAPDSAHPAIRYPMLTLTPEAGPLARHLRSPAARAAFARHGFEVPAP